MRTYYDIQLGDRTVTKRELAGEDLVKVGRNHIARTLLELGAATVDPLSPANPLIFSAGPFAGSSFSNANRTSVGCKSPLTGGIKEANGGGTFGYGMGQLRIAGFTLHGASPDWVVLHFKKDGSLDFDDARPYLGKGNFEANRMLLARYGKKVATALCGPVGEYQGLIAGIAFTDKDLRPSRLAARGGVGAVLGSKKVKAIVLDLDKIPPFADPKKTNASIKDYSKMLLADGIVTNFYQPLGTMGMADVQNQMGGLPVRNFSAGQLADVKAGETFKMGGQFIAPVNTGRGGEQTHACMPGCVIQCSNVYVDASGKEIVSPVEYETLGLLGSNCGLTDPDDLAGLNEIANDMGVDTIETGATLAVLMEAGLRRFGDAKFLARCLRGMMAGTPPGRILAPGPTPSGGPTRSTARPARISQRSSSRRWGARRGSWSTSSTAAPASPRRTTSCRSSSIRSRWRPPTTSRASTGRTSTGCTSGCRHDADRRQARRAAAARRQGAGAVGLDDRGPGDHRQVRRRHRRSPVDPRGRRAGQEGDAGRQDDRPRLPHARAGAAHGADAGEGHRPQARAELRQQQGALHQCGARGLAHPAPVVPHPQRRAGGRQRRSRDLGGDGRDRGPGASGPRGGDHRDPVRLGPHRPASVGSRLLYA